MTIIDSRSDTQPDTLIGARADTSVHPVVAAADAVVGALDEVAVVEPMYMSPAAKRAALLALTVAERRLAELRLRVMASADDVAVADGARDVAAWLAHTTRSEAAPLRADLRLAEAVDRRWFGVRAAMSEGRVSVEQARVIVAGLEALPDHVDAEVMARAEAQLVEYASQFRAGQLRRLARRILHVVAPEIADAEDAKRLEAEEQHAREKCRLTLRPDGEGVTRLSGLIPDAEATRLRTYLESFTAPRTAEDALGGEEDRIPYRRRLGHAFCTLLEHLDPAGLPAHGGDATTMLVTVDLESLRADLATAGLLHTAAPRGEGPADALVADASGDLSAGQARRLACTATIIPAVLGADSEILDLGRSARLFSPAQRKALRLRDRGCRAEGCTIPATWCEAHHRQPWTAGGATDLDDGVLLCSWHHHRIHDQRYEHELLSTGAYRIRRRQ